MPLFRWGCHPLPLPRPLAVTPGLTPNPAPPHESDSWLKKKQPSPALMAYFDVADVWRCRGYLYKRGLGLGYRQQRMSLQSGLSERWQREHRHGQQGGGWGWPALPTGATVRGLFRRSPGSWRSGGTARGGRAPPRGPGSSSSSGHTYPRQAQPPAACRRSGCPAANAPSMPKHHTPPQGARLRGCLPPSL